ncbi:helix-turn-helix domain-containing protein, partial [Enterobacter hormaechei]|uniref:helix-turn-helix domain-containing protein n=1 Tax=Enterobacter hormaechei TaxID=158836 RepID=UPI001F0D611E
TAPSAKGDDKFITTDYLQQCPMQVISAVAEFERDLLLERTYSGIARAKAAGKRFGRPPILSEEQKQTVTERLNAGISISAIAREFNTTRQTILRVKAGLLQE